VLKGKKDSRTEFMRTFTETSEVNNRGEIDSLLIRLMNVVCYDSLSRDTISKSQM